MKKDKDKDKKIRDLQKSNSRLRHQMHEYEQNVARQLQAIVEMYEARLAYLIDATGGTLYDDDVEKWGKDKGKEYAIVGGYDTERGRLWQVVYKDDEVKQTKQHRPS